MSLFPYFMRMKTLLRFEISASYQRINGKTKIIASIRYWLQREWAKNKDAEKIGKEAFLLYLNDSIQYLSFDDTITACKKCAFSFDINKMELCPECKKHYKGLQYPTCIQCLPEEKRKAALESIEFGKEMWEMHRILGID